MITRSKAPLRLGLAGGGSDVSPYSDIHGGLILNATINLYTYYTIEATQDNTITINAYDANCNKTYPTTKYLKIDDEAGFIKGVYNSIIKDFGLDTTSYKITTYNDAPAGLGLGPSSTMVVCILKTFVEWHNLPLGDYEISRLTYDRYYETIKDIETGKVYAHNLKNKQKAIFLNRDETINKLAGFINKSEQFELLPGAAEAIKLANKSGYLTIVVTNQPVIVHGECSFEELQAIYNKMETELGKEGAFVDSIYVYPHHTDKGFTGERPEYKFDCDCRKPKPGLLLHFNIDLSQSYMIGDSNRDIEAGKNAGVKEAIKIEENKPKDLLKNIEVIIN